MITLDEAPRGYLFYDMNQNCLLVKHEQKLRLVFVSLVWLIYGFLTCITTTQICIALKTFSFHRLITAFVFISAVQNLRHSRQISQ